MLCQLYTYYTAGWVLSQVLLAKTVAKHLRRPYELFATEYSISKKDALDEGLPSEVVDRREKTALHRSSKQFFFLFIQGIESVFLSNLNLKMMMAYSDGNLCEGIRRGIMTNDTIVGEFIHMCNNVENMPLEISVRMDIMAFALKKYVNMMGHWFLKTMKGHQKGFKDDAISGKAATRTKVAATIACSKAKADALKERDQQVQIEYEIVASNLLERAEMMMPLMKLMTLIQSVAPSNI
jgi:hypothetical protein